jgi:hypothetical protein
MLRKLEAASIAAAGLWYIDDQYCHGTFLRGLESLASLVVYPFT